MQISVFSDGLRFPPVLDPQDENHCSKVCVLEVCERHRCLPMAGLRVEFRGGDGVEGDGSEVLDTSRG